MVHRKTQIGLAAASTLAAAVLIAGQLEGQSPSFRMGQGMNMQQFMNQNPALNNAIVGNSRNMGFMVNPNTASAMYSNPYASAYGNQNASMSGNQNSSYGNQYYSDPYSSYLNGASQVITSQGQFMVSQQQAFSLREQVRQAAVTTRRKLFDESLYEQEKAPTAQDERDRYLAQQLARSRNNPPSAEIMSGKALNDLLADLQKLSAKNDTATLRTFPAALDEDGLKRINVAPFLAKGNIALLKDAGRLVWPVALSGPEFKEQRDRLTSLAPTVVKQAEFNNQVDPGSLRQMDEDVTRMRGDLRRIGIEMPPAQYIAAKSYLESLDSAIAVLRQPNVGHYFTGKYTLKGKTVPDLVKYMAAQGLRFAPAMPGEQATYQALYQALVQYDLALQPATAER